MIMATGGYDASRYEYTETWFLDSEIHKMILGYVNPTLPIRILEIGCFEGLSSCFFADEMLLHEDSRLVCVDPFDSRCTTTCVTTETERRFRENISKSLNSSRIEFHRMMSDDYFDILEMNDDDKFDLIYIDGSHEPDQKKKDFDNAFRVLKEGGILWLDDYRGYTPPDAGFPPDRIRRAIDECIGRHFHLLTILHCNYQIAIRKVEGEGEGGQSPPLTPLL